MKNKLFLPSPVYQKQTKFLHFGTVLVTSSFRYENPVRSLSQGVKVIRSRR